LIDDSDLDRGWRHHADAPRLLVLVLACRAAPYPEMVETIKRTWAAAPPEGVEVLFYYGGDELRVSGTDVYLPVEDDLAHVGHKTIAAFEYALSHCEFDLVFRANCATYVDLPNLQRFARVHAKPAGFYAGKGGSHDSINFAAGSGYFLSRDLVELVVRERASWDHGHLDDVALGKLLHEHGVERVFAPRAVVDSRRAARHVDLSQFQFRCKAESRGTRLDAEIMTRIHDQFAQARTKGQSARRRRRRSSGARVRRPPQLRPQLGAAIRRAPGGAELLSLRRRALIEVGRRRHPPRPPVDYPGRVLQLSETPDGDAFLTGNGLASRCRYVLNYDALTVNENVDNNWWFCKADFLEYFFSELQPRDEFVLFSHNSDRSIDERFRRRLNRRNLVAWFAQNAAFAHPKLYAVPIGIANPYWPHGDGGTLARVQAAPPARSRLFDVSFAVGTNRDERELCLNQLGLSVEPPAPFEQYLRRLASAHFCVSPRGNGIDTHRTWEALYLRTVPIVTRSVLSDQHAELPMVVLDDWSEVRTIDFTPELYERTIGDWDPVELRLDRYLERVKRVLEGSGGSQR
jgi:hypothetical protein